MHLSTPFRDRRIAKCRADAIIAEAPQPVLCEGLECRLLMSVSSWVITWTGTTPTSASLVPGPIPGQVDVRLNTNANPADPPNFRFADSSGMDLIILGNLTDFTVIDRVPAALKPAADLDGDKGIKVQGGTNGTLVIDASGRDASNDPTHPNDTLFIVKDSDHVEVTDRSDSSTVDGFSYFGSGVSHLVIKTNNVDAAGFRIGGNTQSPDPNDITSKSPDN